MTRYAHCFFCDDIRYEIGNKTTLIGLYSGEMFVSQMPSILPKLCFHVECTTSVDNPFRTMTFRISDGDTVLLEQAIPDQELAVACENLLKKNSPDDPLVTLSMGMNLVASPFLVDKPTTVIVNVIADKEEILAGKLRIKQGDALAPQT